MIYMIYTIFKIKQFLKIGEFIAIVICVLSVMYILIRLKIIKLNIGIKRANKKSFKNMSVIIAEDKQDEKDEMIENDDDQQTACSTSSISNIIDSFSSWLQK